MPFVEIQAVLKELHKIEKSCHPGPIYLDEDKYVIRCLPEGTCEDDGQETEDEDD